MYAEPIKKVKKMKEANIIGKDGSTEFVIERKKLFHKSKKN